MYSTFSRAHFMDLLYMLAWRDIRVRYKQSVMGLMWAVLTPALLIGAGLMIRTGIAYYAGKEVTASDVGSLMVRAVCWTFFIGALRVGTQSLLSNISLVTKVAFPREVLPLSAVLAALFDFAVAVVVVMLVLLIQGWVPTYHVVWVPFFVLSLLGITVGLTLLLSAANLFFRDVKYLVDIILTYAVFFTPVLYESRFAGKWEDLLMLNPISPLLEGISDVIILHKSPDPFWTTYGSIMAMATLLAGYWLFKRLEAKFAESI